MAKKTSASQTSQTLRKHKDGGARETIESVAIAFALAFLFKTFQAEAYVIPTGSMAPTLYGRHKEVTCPSCHYDFQVGASTELDDVSGYIIDGQRIKSTLCPNCRRLVNAEEAPVFNGDRIIVNKDVSEFRRFDVVVFKNPEEGHVNYIKRLVGLPGETIRIRQGNLWMRRGDEDAWKMLRKDDPEIQKSIQLLVYDDRYPARDLIDAGWPERWAPVMSDNSDPESVGGWKVAENGWSPNYETREYVAAVDDGEWHWLRYRHFVAGPSDWRDVDQGAIRNVPQASLISDYCGFNVAATARHDSFDSNSYWVGDLTLNCRLTIADVSDGASIRLELIEGPDTFMCTIDPSTGTTDVHRINRRTDRDGENAELLATGQSSISGNGDYDLTFANVDNRLLLWLDGTLVQFDQPLEIGQNFADALTLQPGQADTAPCGIAVRNMTASVSDLLIHRDIYYRNDAYRFDAEEGYTGSPYDLTERSKEVSNPSILNRQLRDPDAWARRAIQRPGELGAAGYCL